MNNKLENILKQRDILMKKLLDIKDKETKLRTEKNLILDELNEILKRITK